MKPETPPQYNAYWLRLGAGIFDGLCLFIPLNLLMVILLNIDIPTWLLAVGFTFRTFAYIIYSVGMHALWGQTLGKMVTRCRVVSLDGHKLTLKQALYRDSPLIITQIIAFCAALPVVISHTPSGIGFLDFGQKLYPLQGGYPDSDPPKTFPGSQGIFMPSLVPVGPAGWPAIEDKRTNRQTDRRGILYI